MDSDFLLNNLGIKKFYTQELSFNHSDTNASRSKIWTFARDKVKVNRNTTTYEGKKDYVSCEPKKLFRFLISSKKSGRMFYEILRERPSKFYMDLDACLKINAKVGNENHHKIDVVKISILQDFRKFILNSGESGIRDHHKILNLEKTLDRVVIGSSTKDEYKFSWHVIYPDLIFINNFHCGALMRRFEYWIVNQYGTKFEENPYYVYDYNKKSDDCFANCVIDRGVYGKNRLMRLMWNSKYRENPEDMRFLDPRMYEYCYKSNKYVLSSCNKSINKENDKICMLEKIEKEGEDLNYSMFKESLIQYNKTNNNNFLECFEIILTNEGKIDKESNICPISTSVGNNPWYIKDEDQFSLNMRKNVSCSSAFKKSICSNPISSFSSNRLINNKKLKINRESYENSFKSLIEDPDLYGKMLSIKNSKFYQMMINVEKSIISKNCGVGILDTLDVNHKQFLGVKYEGEYKKIKKSPSSSSSSSSSNSSTFEFPKSFKELIDDEMDDNVEYDMDKIETRKKSLRNEINKIAETIIIEMGEEYEYWSSKDAPQKFYGVYDREIDESRKVVTYIYPEKSRHQCKIRDHAQMITFEIHAGYSVRKESIRKKLLKEFNLHENARTLNKIKTREYYNIGAIKQSCFSKECMSRRSNPNNYKIRHTSKVREANGFCVMLARTVYQVELFSDISDRMRELSELSNPITLNIPKPLIRDYTHHSLGYNEKIEMKMNTFLKSCFSQIKCFFIKYTETCFKLSRTKYDTGSITEETEKNIVDCIDGVISKRDKSIISCALEIISRLDEECTILNIKNINKKNPLIKKTVFEKLEYDKLSHSLEKSVECKSSNSNSKIHRKNTNSENEESSLEYISDHSLLNYSYLDDDHVDDDQDDSYKKSNIILVSSISEEIILKTILEISEIVNEKASEDLLDIYLRYKEKMINSFFLCPYTGLSYHFKYEKVKLCKFLSKYVTKYHLSTKNKEKSSEVNKIETMTKEFLEYISRILITSEKVDKIYHKFFLPESKTIIKVFSDYLCNCTKIKYSMLKNNSSDNITKWREFIEKTIINPISKEYAYLFSFKLIKSFINHMSDL